MKKLTFLKPARIAGKTRLGNKYDGGYVVYGAGLQEIDVLISYGVGWDTAFEEDFSRVTNKKVLMFDPTMFGRYLFDISHFGKLIYHGRLLQALIYPGIVWNIFRKKKKLERKDMYFINEGLSAVRSEKYDTFTGHIRRFDLHKKRILLKVDIEGHEYDVFCSGGFFECLSYVDQLIVEFHDLKNRLRELQFILAKLAADFDLIHIHGNNYEKTFVLYGHLQQENGDMVLPDVVELSFVRKDKVKAENVLEEGECYPVKDLDYPNDPSKADYAIGFI
jgi:predicted RNA-binding protein